MAHQKETQGKNQDQEGLGLSTGLDQVARTQDQLEAEDSEQQHNKRF